MGSKRAYFLHSPRVRSKRRKSRLTGSSSVPRRNDDAPICCSFWRWRIRGRVSTNSASAIEPVIFDLEPGDGLLNAQSELLPREQYHTPSMKRRQEMMIRPSSSSWRSPQQQQGRIEKKWCCLGVGCRMGRPSFSLCYFCCRGAWLIVLCSFVKECYANSEVISIPSNWLISSYGC